MQKQKRILFVDDEPDIVRLVEFRLNKEGFAVIHAKDGNEALGLLAHEKPDLILLDLLLPDIDGLEVCRMIKLEPDLKDIPVIFFTASAAEPDKLEEKVRHLGAQGLIIKPFTSEELLNKIRRFI